jgi:hypothetical protein
VKQTYYFQVLFQVKISKLQGESKLKISVLQTFYLYTVPYSNGDSQTFLSALKTQDKKAHQKHLAHQQQLAHQQLSNTPLISSTRDKLCDNPLRFFFFSPTWPILQLKPTLLLVMPLLSVLNKNNNKEVSN